MPARQWHLRITDIVESICAIHSYVAGMSYEVFAADPKTIDAVVRRFTIIGEAANHIPSDIAAAHPAIPWNTMREMRNVVVHAYFGVNPLILWETIHNDLPPLIPKLEAVLKSATNTSRPEQQ